MAHQVKVPQNEGEIHIQTYKPSGELLELHYHVTDGHVSVANKEDLQVVLTSVDGAKESSGSPTRSAHGGASK